MFSRMYNLTVPPLKVVIHFSKVVLPKRHHDGKHGIYGVEVQNGSNSHISSKKYFRKCRAVLYYQHQSGEYIVVLPENWNFEPWGAFIPLDSHIFVLYINPDETVIEELLRKENQATEIALQIEGDAKLAEEMEDAEKIALQIERDAKLAEEMEASAAEVDAARINESPAEENHALEIRQSSSQYAKIAKELPIIDNSSSDKEWRESLRKPDGKSTNQKKEWDSNTECEDIFGGGVGTSKRGGRRSVKFMIPDGNTQERPELYDPDSSNVALGPPPEDIARRAGLDLAEILAQAEDILRE